MSIQSDTSSDQRFLRCFKGELRKLHDTPGRLFAIIGLASLVLITGVASFFYGSAEGSSSPLVAISTMMVLLMIALPIFTVIHLSFEHSNRSVQITFLLEPDRRLVWLAKLLSCLVLSITFIIGVVLTAIPLNYALTAVAGREADMSGIIGQPDGIISLAIPVIANVLVAAAIGSLISSLAGAIIVYVTFFAFIDVLFGLLTQGNAKAFSYGGSISALQNGDAGLASVAIGLWTLVPLLIGGFVFARREVS